MAGFSGDRTEDIAWTDALVLSDVDEETRYVLISATASSAVSSTTAAAALILETSSSRSGGSPLRAPRPLRPSSF